MSRPSVSPVRAPRALTAAQFVTAVGDGAYFTCSALYFTEVAGVSSQGAGLGLTLAWGVAALAGVPLGHAADRRGPRGTAVVLAFVTAVSVAGLLAVRSFAPFLGAVCLYATAQTGLAAARQALVGGLVGSAGRTGVLARLQATANAGLAVGAALGGLAIAAGSGLAFTAVLAVDALCFVAGGLLLLRLPVVAPVRRDDGGGEGGARFAVLRDRPYAVVAGLNAVLLLRMPLLSLVVPLWIATRSAELRWLVAPLFAVNTVAVTLFQVRAARGITGLASASRAVQDAGLLLCASCAVFAVSASGGRPWAVAAVLVAAAGLLVAGEMRQSAGSWQVAFDLAPPDRLGQYQGFFGTGVAAARTVGPLLLTSLVLGWGAAGWLATGGLFLVAGLAMGPAVRWAGRTRADGGPTAIAPAT